MLARRVLGRAAILAAVAPLVLIWSTPAAAQQPADQATINRRIDQGKEWLQKQQKPAGWWGTGNKMQEAHGIGYTCLVGLTLVECGVPTTDPKLKQAAALVRSLAYEIDSTYELSLAILFLDRMKDKVDKRVIQLLAGRLISAQMPSGGWGYKTHKYPEPSVLQLLAALRKLSNPPAEGPKPDIDKLRLSVPADMRRLAVWDTTTGALNADPKDKRSDLYDATTDNSNTHFAMIGLLAAREYEIPVDRSFALVARRFRTSQGKSGTWSYDFFPSGNNGANQYTCIALLGVAIGHVYSPPEVKPEADPVIISAFTALSRSVGEPVGDISNRPKVKDVGGLYFLWAMERIAILYDIQKLGKKDWYLWGAEILLCAQAANGSWDEDGGFAGQQPIINTCLALLFLRRANLTPGLSKKLVVDTGVLTAKVEDKIAPKVETPPPSPKVEEPLPTSKIEEPQSAPKEEPKPQATPVTKSAPPPEPEPAPAPKKKSPVVWIILGVLLLAVLGGGLAFLVVKRKNQDGDEAAAKPKKKKKKVTAESGEAKVSKSETTKKPAAAPKVKQDVEVDDD